MNTDAETRDNSGQSTRIRAFMAQDRVSRLIATLMLCLLAGCGTGMRPPVPEQQQREDSFFLQTQDGLIASYSMDLANGDVSLKQRILIPGLGYPAGTDPLGRFLWIAQHDVVEHDTIITAPPTVNTFARKPDGFFSASDQRDYQPRIDEIAVEHHGKFAYDNGAERRIFSISPVDGHLEEAGTTDAELGFVILHPIKNIFYSAISTNLFRPDTNTVFKAYASDSDTGELTPLPNVSTQVPYDIREMKFTSDGNYLIILDFDPSHRVHLLAVDKDGGLREVDALTPASYPYGLVAHPTLPIVYHQSLAGDGLIQAYGVKNGALTELPSIHVGDSDISGNLLHVSSDGRFLLVASRQIYLVTLNPQTGEATDIQPVNFPFP